MNKLNLVAALVLASIVTVGCAPARVTDNSRWQLPPDPERDSRIRIAEAKRAQERADADGKQRELAELNPTLTDDELGPPPKNYKKTSLGMLKNSLRDPDSLKALEIGKPEIGTCKYYQSDLKYKYLQPFKGWRVAVSYNAKNGYGAYAGVTTEYHWYHKEVPVMSTKYPTQCDFLPYDFKTKP